MQFKNTETPTFAGAAGNKPAVVERMALYDRDGNEVAFFLKAVDGTISFEVNGEAYVSADASSVSLAASQIVLSNLPTADPTVAGALWSNSGVVTVSAG